MKITKKQLRKIIREELEFIKTKRELNTNSRVKLSELISENEDGYIKNPETGNKIKISTALSYDKSHPAYQAAAKLKPDQSSDTSADDEYEYEEEDDYQELDINPIKVQDKLRSSLDDDTLSFDGYDASGFPLFISDKNPSAEYYIDNDKNVIYTDGFVTKKVGSIK